MRFALLLLSILIAGSAQAAPVTGRASVIDADTIEIRDTRFRLFGIDAVEARQLCHREGKAWPCGRRAAFALSDHLGQRTVTCVPTGKKSWERLVARCSLAGEDVAAWLVGEGWAVASPKHSADYIEMEAEARRLSKGIWQGSFTKPWECRKGASGC
jgi:endonuclease YncB( thermonuclease family)